MLLFEKLVEAYWTGRLKPTLQRIQVVVLSSASSMTEAAWKMREMVLLSGRRRETCR